MATVFWDSKGIILIDYKPAGTSITGEYYANVIKQLRVAIKEQELHQAGHYTPVASKKM